MNSVNINHGHFNHQNKTEPCVPRDKSGLRLFFENGRLPSGIFHFTIVTRDQFKPLRVEKNKFRGEL